MGISLLTAIKIKNGKVKVLVVGPTPEGKFSGVIALEKGCPLISTNPCYETPEDAEQAMNTIIHDIIDNKEIP